MSSVPPNNSKAIRGWKWWARELVACLLWLALIFCTFAPRVIDGDVLVMTSRVVTIENVSIGVFLMLGLSWLIGLRVMWHVAFIATYPLVVPLRILPRMCVRHWPLLFVFLPGIRGIARGMRLRAGLLCVALAAVVGAFNFTNPNLLLICWLTLVGYLAWIFAHQIHLAYRPVTAYSEIMDILQRVSTWLPSPRDLASKLKNSPPPKENVESSRESSMAANLLVLYGVSTSLHYVGHHLESLQRSFKLDIYLLYCVVKTFVITVGAFCVIFLTMGSHSPTNFKTDGAADWLDYLMFSFCNLMTSDTSGLEPASRIARGFACTEQFFAFGLLVLIVFVVFTSLRERHRTDLQLVVTKFQSASSAISDVFESDFDLTRSAVEGILIASAPAIAKQLIAIHHGREYAQKLYDESVSKKSQSALPIDVPVVKEDQKQKSNTRSPRPRRSSRN